ncbi:MAG: S1 RNA-binding domain-containing protein [Solirubrobacterales bacterium]
MAGGAYRWADRRAALARFRGALRTGERLSGRVVGANRGGVLIRIDDSTGFLPRSQLDLRDGQDHRSLVGQGWTGYALRVSSRKLILTTRSPRARRRSDRRARRFVARLNPGDLLRGRITAVTDYGAFVRLGRHGVKGLIPRRELSWWRIHPADAVSEGQRVRVRVLDVREADDEDPRPPRIGLSLRRTQLNPWPALAAQLPSGAAVRCRVEALTPDGAWLRPIDHPQVQAYLRSAPLLVAGDTVWVQVERVDIERRQLHLAGAIDPPPKLKP